MTIHLFYIQKFGKYCKKINPNKAGLLKVVSSGGEEVHLNPPPPTTHSSFKQNKFCINITLYNCWTTYLDRVKVKYADIICYMLTPLVFLQQGNVKKSEKLILKEKIFISSERREEFQWNF